MNELGDIIIIIIVFRVFFALLAHGGKVIREMISKGTSNCSSNFLTRQSACIDQISLKQIYSIFVLE